MFKTPEFAIYSDVSSYLKSYPTFERLIIYDVPRPVRIKGFEEDFAIPFTPSTSMQKAMSEYNSLRRTKTKLSDLVLCNDFDLFCTFTFAKNRQDLLSCKTRMHKWLENQKNRVGDFSYVIVPEFHKDGKSLHFHGLFKNYQGKLHTTTIRNGSGIIYNLTQYKLGHSTASVIQDSGKVSNYIRKYITKDMPSLPGQKRYWCSKGLIRPQKIENPRVSISDYKELFSANGLRVFHKEKTLQHTILESVVYDKSTN
jgi:hypothetical protein